MEVTPRRPNDMRRRSAVASGRLAVLTAVQHHDPSAPPEMMASTAIRDGGFNEHDLIYITKSPDFCRPDKQSGSLGTVGRTCNATHQSSSGGCASLCCGRGYITVLREVVERCNCKYIWCCTVINLQFWFYQKFRSIIIFLGILPAGPMSKLSPGSPSSHMQIDRRS